MFGKNSTEMESLEYTLYAELHYLPSCKHIYVIGALIYSLSNLKKSHEIYSPLS